VDSRAGVGPEASPAADGAAVARGEPALMFSCPHCAKVIGEYPEAGVAVLVCGSCTFKYELSVGHVVGLDSQRVQVRVGVDSVRRRYYRHYELELRTSPRETLRFRFDTDRDDEWIQMRAGEPAAVVYGMRGTKRNELLWVLNRASRERFILGIPGQTAKARSTLYGVLAGTVAGTAAVMASTPFLLAVGIAGVSGFAVRYGLSRVLRPRHALGADEQLMLSSRQALLAQKRSLLELRASVGDDVERRGALKERLRNLRTRMSAVQLDAYTARIGAIDRALGTLAEQIDVDLRLVAEYDRTLQIVDIEYEASLAADAISLEGSAVIESRLAELRVAEELRAETTRRLAANAEVEQLLGSNNV